MKIKKGDQVQILSGKDQGKATKVVRVFAKEGRVLLENANVYKRHVRKMGNNEGGILDIVKPMNISNVALLCSSCKKPTRIGFKIQDNQKVRICKKCQEEIK